MKYSFHKNLIIFQLLLFLILSSCSKQKKIDFNGNYENKDTITKLDIEKNKKDLFDQYINSLLIERKREMDDFEIKIQDFRIKFDLKFFGGFPKPAVRLINGS